MFYDKFIDACARKGVSPTRVITALNMSKGSLSRWRDGGEATNETKKKVADYLNIPIEELLDKKERPTQIREPEGIDNEIMDKFKQLSKDQKRLVLAQVTAWLNVD